MDDLISRAAALDAIDRERKLLIEREQYSAEHIVVHHAQRQIEELPTIDAIPVEWFTRMIYSCGVQGQINAVAAMNWVLDEWKATKDDWAKE